MHAHGTFKNALLLSFSPHCTCHLVLRHGNSNNIFGCAFGTPISLKRTTGISYPRPPKYTSPCTSRYRHTHDGVFVAHKRATYGHTYISRCSCCFGDHACHAQNHHGYSTPVFLCQIWAQWAYDEHFFPVFGPKKKHFLAYFYFSSVLVDRTSTLQNMAYLSACFGLYLLPFVDHGRCYGYACRLRALLTMVVSFHHSGYLVQRTY